MSVRITPCYRCPLRDGCEQRDEFRRRAHLANATAIRFKCGRLAAALKPGTRIQIYQPFLDEDGRGNYPEIGSSKVSATILSTDGYRFSCLVDEDERIEERKFRFRKMAPAYRIIEFLDEPAKDICSCGNVIENGICHAMAEDHPKCEFFDFDKFF